ncbi:urea ABC transporter permease subunit UrtB [Amphibiibacter pelophylacis]|uniref:Urea ABC transporter permease subunit UrtB n=1 Tax=Amphibiibacter pelophylacis TaxID=1799477 RepID=A0ACC6P1G4_9BURK
MSRLLRALACAAALLLTLLGSPAVQAQQAQPQAAGLQALFSGDFSERLQALQAVADVTSPASERVLRALDQDRLRQVGERVLIQDAGSGAALDPVSGQPVPEISAEALAAGATPVLNNRLRQLLGAALGAYELLSPDVAVRRAAVSHALQSPGEIAPGLVAQALAAEKQSDLRGALQVLSALQALPAQGDALWQSAPDAGDATRATLAVLDTLAQASAPEALPPLRRLSQDESLSKGWRLRVAEALATYQKRHERAQWFNTVFSGLSAASILLMAAMGLAITYGLMGVINMAHGEMLMIGAYATWLTQSAVRSLAPGWLDQYIWLAIPASFGAAALVGMLIESLVLRHLYGKPVDSLLATFGISLILMQTVRTLFGAQNVEVANPSWLAGAQMPFQDWLPGLQLLNSRIAVLVFAAAVLLAVWLLLTRTRLGLFVRAVTQNRRMASCVGVRTRRVDNLAFGLGSGIAGLGGCALSQISNVGPDMGQGHIIDSFMVVVLGGVGQLAGTLVASLGLGVGGKLAEPYMGAVLTRIVVLLLIVLFIQKRPQGLFALKGRSAEA